MDAPPSLFTRLCCGASLIAIKIWRILFLYLLTRSTSTSACSLIHIREIAVNASVRRTMRHLVALAMVPELVALGDGLVAVWQGCARNGQIFTRNYKLCWWWKCSCGSVSSHKLNPKLHVFQFTKHLEKKVITKQTQQRVHWVGGRGGWHAVRRRVVVVEWSR